MSLMLEISIKFFFENFVYTFGNEKFLQSQGGPIGARLTMCIARLIMQDWWTSFYEILKDANIEVYMRAIYVDDGRLIVEILKKGVYFDENLGKFVENPENSDPIDHIEADLDLAENMERTINEIRKAMNYISKDLRFTTETEKDFSKKRLPTLSFELWSELEGIRHSFV